MQRPPTFTSRKAGSAHLTRTTVPVIIATVFLMLSGVALLYYATFLRPVQLQARATAVVQAYQATNTSTIATVKAQSTQAVHTSATVLSRATVQAQVTATAMEDILTRSTRRIPDINSSLAFQTTTNWDSYITQDGGGCAFRDNHYHASVFKQDFYTACIAHATNFNNVAIEVQMTIIRGNEGGLLFHSTNNDKNFYSFRLSSDGTYSLLLTQNDNHIVSLVYDKSTLIKTGTGQPNLLTIIAQGPNFYLYINRHFVASASDSTYTSGTLGLVAVDRTAGTDIAFSNLRVWRL